MFYIYEWYNKDTGEIFYVGKGTRNRYKVKKRSACFNEYLEHNNCDVRILAYYEDELMCFKAEENRIQELKQLNQCQCNNVYGGCGGVKTYWTTEMRNKMSIENPMKDAEQRKRMSENNPMKDKEVAKKVGEKHAKPFMINDKLFNTLEQAAKYYNKTPQAILFWLKNGKNPYNEKCYYVKKKNLEINVKTELCYIIYKNIKYKTIVEISEKTGIKYRTLENWIKKGFSSNGDSIRYSNDNKEYTYIKPNKTHSNIQVEINGIIYGSKKEAVTKTGIPISRLNKLLNNDYHLEKCKARYKDLCCRYVNQQPSHTKSDNSSVEGSTTNE